MLALLASCQQESVRPDDQGGAGDPRTLTFRASVEDATRAMIGEIDDSADLSVKFTQDEKILLFVTQGETTITLTSEVSAVTPDGKGCTFEATLPEEIDASQPMDIIGYSGIQDRMNYKKELDFFYIEDGEVYLNVLPQNSWGIDTMRPPIAFTLKGYKASEGNISDLDVLFEHLGVYEVMHATNKGTKEIPANKLSLTLAAKGSGYTPETPWRMDKEWSSEEMTSYYPYVSLTSHKVKWISGKYVSSSATLPALPVGETMTVVNWFYPSPGASYGDVVTAYHSTSYKDTYSANFVTSNDPILVGQAYHAFADIYDDKVVMKTRSGEEIEEIVPRVEFTTDLPKGSEITLYTFYDFRNRNKAFIDLNDNGVKDSGEDIGSAYGNYTKTVDSPKITIYGIAEALRINANGVTNMRLYGQDNLVQLEVKKNKMDAKALNQVMKDLPDVHDVEASDATPKTFSLDENPGAKEEGLDLMIAVKKDWTVDVPIIDMSQDFIYLWMVGSTGTIYLNVDAAPEDRDGIWVDLNGNGITDEGEKITEFGLGADAMNVLDRTTKNLIVYGKVTKLAAPESNVFACIESKGNALTYLDLSTNQIAALVMENMVNLEYLDVSNNDFQTDAVPFLTLPFPKLKVLNIANSGITEIDGGLSENTELTYLNANGCGFEELDLSANTKLQSLFLSNNALTSLDVSPLTQLTYLEVIGNQLKGEALANLIEGLPTVSGTTPGKLFIAGNPGASGTDIEPAQEKNWKVDTDHLKGDNYIVRPSLPGEEW